MVAVPEPGAAEGRVGAAGPMQAEACGTRERRQAQAVEGLEVGVEQERARVSAEQAGEE